MVPWWEIRYFNRESGLEVLNSAMLPFKSLPELDRTDVCNGHKFKTDQFEIEIPGANIILHMPSKSLWIDNAPYYVEDAIRVVLFQRTHMDTANTTTNQNIFLGLMADDGSGLIVKYNIQNKSWELIAHPNNVKYKAKTDASDLPALPDFEKA